MRTLNPEALAAGLKKWTATSDPHVQAAVNLLIEHDYWLRTTRFVNAAVRGTEPEVGFRVAPDSGPYIVWREAREAFNAGEFNQSSTSQVAVLDLAITLGENRFKLNLMGDWHARIMANAFAEAAHVKTAGESR